MYKYIPVDNYNGKKLKKAKNYILHTCNVYLFLLLKLYDVWSLEYGEVYASIRYATIIFIVLTCGSLYDNNLSAESILRLHSDSRI